MSRKLIDRKLIDETKEYVIDVINMIAAEEFPCSFQRFLEKFKKETGYEYEMDPYSVVRSLILGEWTIEIQRDALDFVHANVNGEPVTIALSVNRIIARNKTGEIMLISMNIGEVWTVTKEDLLWD